MLSTAAYCCLLRRPTTSSEHFPQIADQTQYEPQFLYFVSFQTHRFGTNTDQCCTDQLGSNPKKVFFRACSSCFSPPGIVEKSLRIRYFNLSTRLVTRHLTDLEIK